MESVFLLLLLAVVTVLLIVPARRQRRLLADAQKLQNSLINGDRVITTSGLYATVVDTGQETTVDLEIAPGVRTTWMRAAIREKVTEGGDAVDGDRESGASTTRTLPSTTSPAPTTPD